MRIGILSFAHMHAESYAACLRAIDDVDLVGIADEDEARGRSAAERYGTRYFRDYRDLLGEGLDGALICSENSRHKEMALAAAGAKAHILCEKPIATSIEDSKEMIEAAEREGVKLQIAFPCRFHPAVMRAREIIGDGALGKVLAVNGTNRGVMPGGWFTDRELAGGGAIIDHTVHVVDLIRWMLGTEVRSVYAEIDTRFHRLDVDDCGIISMELDNGGFATLDASWSRPVNAFPTWGDVTMEITGTRGLLSLDVFAQNIDLYNNDRVRAEWVNWGDNMDMGLVRDWVDSMRENKPPSVSGLDGLRALEVALAAYRSAESGEPVLLR